jgi:hypothetical protein
LGQIIARQVVLSFLYLNVFSLTKLILQTTKTSTLIAYGEPKGYSAMALTVGIPAAIGADLILQGLGIQSSKNLIGIHVDYP